MTATEWVQMPENKAALRKVKAFGRGSGCEFPAEDCAWCSAWLSGYRNEGPDPTMTIRDETLIAAYRAGLRARPRKPKP